MDVGNMLAQINDVLSPHGFDDIVNNDFAELREILHRLPDCRNALGSTSGSTDAASTRKKTRRFVVIMHGVRDEGEWMPPLERLIEAETGAEAKAIKLDRISLTRFLLAERFLGYVKACSDDVSRLLSHYNEVDVFFIAHSYARGV